MAKPFRPKMRRLAIIIIFFTLSGCKKILTTYYGISQPKIENESSLKHFLVKNGYSDTIKIYAFKDLNTFYSALQKAKLPDAQFFNKNGYYVDYHLKPEDCNESVGPFIESSENINQLNHIDSIKITEVLKDVIDINTKNPIELKDSIDSYIILYWAKFLGGKLNREKSLEWLEVYNASPDKNKNVQLIFLNMDYQDFWGINENDLPNFDYK